MFKPLLYLSDRWSNVSTHSGLSDENNSV